MYRIDTPKGRLPPDWVYALKGYCVHITVQVYCVQIKRRISPRLYIHYLSQPMHMYRIDTPKGRFPPDWVYTLKGYFVHLKVQV